MDDDHEDEVEIPHLDKPGTERGGCSEVEWSGRHLGDRCGQFGFGAAQ